MSSYHTFVLVDVGSANGIYPLFEQLLQYSTQIHTFEPESDGYSNCFNNEFINNNFGLFDQKGTYPLYLTHKRECSSLLEPNLELLNKYHNPERFGVDKIIDIDVVRFDDYFKGKYIDVIKLDTQGTEYGILKGVGDKLLSNTKFVITEAEFIEMYKNQKLFHNIYKYLSSLGFRILKLDRLVFAANDKYYNYTEEIYDELLQTINNSNVKYKSKLIELLDFRHNYIMNILKCNNHSITTIYKIQRLSNYIKACDTNSILMNSTLFFCDAVFINTKFEDRSETKTIIDLL